MSDLTIRICFRRKMGEIEDGQEDFGLSTFGGVLPSIGDTILDPGVAQGLDRQDPANRRMWTVLGRIFNPRDLENYVALIVDEHTPTKEERAFVA